MWAGRTRATNRYEDTSQELDALKKKLSDVLATKAESSWRLVSAHDTQQIAKNTARGRRPDYEFCQYSTKKRKNKDCSFYQCTTAGCLVSRKVSFDKSSGKWQLLERGPKDHDHAPSVRPKYPYTSAQLKIFEAYMIKTESNPNPTPAGCYQAMVDQCPADSEGL